MLQLGKAGYLPDISGRFNQWTAYATKSLEMKNYLGAIGGLNNMNALLDEEHRITVNTREYEARMKEETLYTCNFCTMEQKEVINKGEEDERIEVKEIPRELTIDQITFFDFTPEFIEVALTQKKSVKAWVCSNCKKVNRLGETEIIQPEKEAPYYIGVVPEQPLRKGMVTRLGFDDRFRKYFNNYSEELEHAMMTYRVNYIQQHGEDMGELVFKDKGDQ